MGSFAKTLGMLLYDFTTATKTAAIQSGGNHKGYGGGGGALLNQSDREGGSNIKVLRGAIPQLQVLITLPRTYDLTRTLTLFLINISKTV